MCYLQDGGDDEAPVRVLMKADPSTRESLQTEAEVDPMDGEQTWPTESELLEAEGADTETSALSLLKHQRSIRRKKQVVFTQITGVKTFKWFFFLFRGQEEQTSHEGP